jgi:hypothetical protein
LSPKHVLSPGLPLAPGLIGYLTYPICTYRGARDVCITSVHHCTLPLTNSSKTNYLRARLHKPCFGIDQCNGSLVHHARHKCAQCRRAGNSAVVVHCGAVAGTDEDCIFEIFSSIIKSTWYTVFVVLFDIFPLLLPLGVFENT